jgi:hypothetical protein
MMLRRFDPLAHWHWEWYLSAAATIVRGCVALLTSAVLLPLNTCVAHCVRPKEMHHAPETCSATLLLASLPFPVGLRVRTGRCVAVRRPSGSAPDLVGKLPTPLRLGCVTQRARERGTWTRALRCRCGCPRLCIRHCAGASRGWRRMRQRRRQQVTVQAIRKAPDVVDGSGT